VGRAGKHVGAILGEVRRVAKQGRLVMRLVSTRHRLCLAGAVGVMCLASAGNTAIPLCLGWLIDAVNPEANPARSQAELGRIAGFYLGLIGLAYLVRETMNVLRRYLVEEMCTRIDKETSVQVIAHLMKADLSRLARHQVGALYGRITRSIEGLI